MANRAKLEMTLDRQHSSLTGTADLVHRSGRRQPENVRGTKGRFRVAGLAK